MTQWFHFWEYIQRNPKVLIQKNICTPMLTVVLFTRVKIWKQSRCPSGDEWIKKATIQWNNGILLAVKNEGNLTFWDSTGLPGKYYAESNKLVKERQAPYDFIHICNRKKINKLETDSDTENKWIAVRGEGAGGGAEWKKQRDLAKMYE